MALFEELENAMAVYLRWKRDPVPTQFDALVADHPEMGDLLQVLRDEEVDELVPFAATDSIENRGERSLGPYQLDEELGRGATGIVFSARHRETGGVVAVKVLRDHHTLNTRAVIRFLKEAKMASSLRHPAIAHIHDVGRDGEHYYFAMDRIEGLPLSVILRRLTESHSTPLLGSDLRTAVQGEGEDWPEDYAASVVAILSQVGGALAAAHDAQILHRDVKPSNIIVDTSGRATLTDFGLARDQTSDSQTLTGEFAGSPHYVSPEQAMAKRVAVDPRSDVFSLGATLYEMLTLQKAFPGTSPAEALSRVLTKPPIDPRALRPGVPDSLAAVCFKALEKDPDRRYPSATEMVRDLRAFADARPVQAPPLSNWSQLRRWASHNRIAAGLLLVILVILLAASAMLTSYALTLQRRNLELLGLADRKLVASLRGHKHKLASHSAAQIAALEDWMRQADELQARMPSHQRRLQELRHAALPYSAADRAEDATRAPGHGALLRQRSILAAFEASPRSEEMDERIRNARAQLETMANRPVPRRTWRFANPQLNWEHQQVSDLVEDLKKFHDPENGIYAVVNGWLSHARTVQERSLIDGASAWKRAQQAIHESPHYQGLEIQPQLGLLPLGPDPASGLWEFAHLQSGQPAAREEGERAVVGPDTGLVFVLLPGGTSRIGAVRPDANATQDGSPMIHGQPHVDRSATFIEGPVREVTLAPFFISKYEMTQGQWWRFCRERPASNPQPDWEIQPLQTVHWKECSQFLASMGLTIPTSAQWEYAARAGTSTPMYTGTEPSSLQGHLNALDESMLRQMGLDSLAHQFQFDDGAVFATAVGSYAANPFGLHDIFGNVDEWVGDVGRMIAHPLRPGDGAKATPVFRAAVRGGSFSSGVQGCRASAYEILDLWTRAREIGIRPARPLR